MAFDSIIWDLDDDPDGNVHHCAGHGVTKEEGEEIFQNATDKDIVQSACGMRRHQHGPPLEGGIRRNRRRHRVPGDGLRRSQEATTMKRITRGRRLTPEEAAKYEAIRGQVAGELPDLIERHHERTATLDQLRKLFAQLKAAREAKGSSLADVTELTGMDRSSLSKMETGQRANPSVETLIRYADAVGKRLVVSLTDV